MLKTHQLLLRNRDRQTRPRQSWDRRTAKLKHATWEELKPRRDQGGGLSLELNIRENLIVISCIVKGSGEKPVSLETMYLVPK